MTYIMSSGLLYWRLTTTWCIITTPHIDRGLISSKYVRILRSTVLTACMCEEAYHVHCDDTIITHIYIEILYSPNGCYGECHQVSCSLDYTHVDVNDFLCHLRACMYMLLYHMSLPINTGGFTLLTSTPTSLVKCLVNQTCLTYKTLQYLTNRVAPDADHTSNHT
jgi:hypothetical protein